MKHLYFLLLLSSLGLCLPGHAQLVNQGQLINEGGHLIHHPAYRNEGSYEGLGLLTYRGPAQASLINEGIFQAGLNHRDVFEGPHGKPGPQEITGTQRPSFYHLEFRNGSGQRMVLSNTQGVNVRGSLWFDNGITTTPRLLQEQGALRFETEASYTGGGTDAQHVDGYVSKIGSSAFVFPVGSGTDCYRLEMSAPDSASAHLSVAWLNGDPGQIPDPSDGGALHDTQQLSGTLTAVSTVGQWDWIAVKAPTNPLTIRVFIPEMHAFSPRDELRLVGWNGTYWMDLSERATASGTGKNSTLEGILLPGQSVSALAIGRAVGALPVEWLSFSARVVESNQVALQWATVREENNHFFQIEHARDGKTFEARARVNGQGTLRQTTQYTWIDTVAIPQGLHYYRLRQVDRDGKVAYSRVRSVDFGSGLTQVYPNPARHTLQVATPAWAPVESITCWDGSGRLHYETRPLTPLVRIPVQHWAPGVYLIQIAYSSGSTVRQKVLIIP